MSTCHVYISFLLHNPLPSHLQPVGCCTMETPNGKGDDEKAADSNSDNDSDDKGDTATSIPALLKL